MIILFPTFAHKQKNTYIVARELGINFFLIMTSCKSARLHRTLNYQIDTSSLTSMLSAEIFPD